MHGWINHKAVMVSYLRTEHFQSSLLWSVFKAKYRNIVPSIAIETDEELAKEEYSTNKFLSSDKFCEQEGR